MAYKLVDDASCANGGDPVARKPWSTPHVILSTEMRSSNKTQPDLGDTHIAAPGSPSDSSLAGS
jgi:hypothetical protein